MEILSGEIPTDPQGSRDLGISSLKSEWLNTREAASYLRISERSLLNLCSNGKIPYYKLQRRNRYRLSELRDLLLLESRGS